MGFFDLFRRKKPSPTALEGTDGVFAYGGNLVSFEKRPELRGKQLYTTFDNMITNAVIVGASVRYFQNLVGGTGWSITADEEAGEDGQRAAEIVEDGLINAQLESMPWSSVVRKAALYRFYGFSAHEWKLRRRPRDGMMVYADIQHRPQYTVELWDVPDDGGRFSGFAQRAYGKGKLYYVARDQMFYCVDNTLNDNPDGLGLLRHVAEHTRRLAEYEKYEGYGYQSDLRGMPVGRVPGKELKKSAEGKPDGWFDAQVAAVNQLVANHFKTANQGLVLDSEPYRDTQGNPTSSIPKWAIELIKSESNGLADIHVVIERLNREIARVLGMEFLMLGGDGKGSLALSRDKTSMFASMLEATLSEMANAAMHDLVYPLLRYNGLDPELCAPVVQADPIATERVEAAVAALVGLAQAGAVMQPDDPAINQIRRRLHLADQPEIPIDLLTSMKAPRNPDGSPTFQDENGNPVMTAAEHVPQGSSADDGSVDVDLEDENDPAPGKGEVVDEPDDGDIAAAEKDSENVTDPKKPGGKPVKTKKATPTCAKCGGEMQLKAVEHIHSPGVPMLILKKYFCPACSKKKEV